MSSYLPRASRRFPGRSKYSSSSSSCSASSASYGHGPDPAATLAAQRVSDSIDEDIRKEAALQDGQRRKQVKIILLGQAESGKSTLQKQFQLYHASQTLDAERPSWRIVVYANLVKAIRTILEELEQGPRTRFFALRRELLPLIALESTLTSQLSDGVSFSGPRSSSLLAPRQAGGGTRLVGTRPLGSLREVPEAVVATNRAAQVLGMCARAVDALWRHRSVKELIRSRKLRLDESGSFFMNDVYRIAQPDYVPSIDDLLHVRLQTVGVIEHSMQVRTVSGTYLWKIYDVGGTRSQRPAWASFFDDVNALIFLAPISAFDQYLEEDPLTNRIADSVQLLLAIATNPLLRNAQLVLLLNKTDLLRRKLEAGVQIQDYITSYGTRPNNFSNAAEYFRSHFLSAHKKKEPFRRALYVHFTAMIDIHATQVIIASVEDMIMRRHIAKCGLL
ncbi:hypothetical protein HMN09_00723100 [Mycena chlorophos]|uniref:G-protein alpha subunit n=1 Tax=Mycena chlorophos TaxID=658473 RepID=A0A8H6W4R7_MYCCL|nr:hypothetical protein HMN09_00723100 [Mycena chlorophos]